MRIIGIDDTDSRTGGMCTTWIASEVVRRLSPGAETTTYLVRLCPAIEHKTRGNGAVAIETEATDAFDIAETVIDEHAVRDDPQTNPGLVEVDTSYARRPRVRSFARSAIREPVTMESADELLGDGGTAAARWGNGRGVIGAVAATGAVGGRHADDPAFADWTHEHIGYRDPSRWGTSRSVTLPDPLPGSPAVWDTVDGETGEAVCVPRSPCPVLVGVRGDRPGAIDAVVDGCEGERIARIQRFRSNQGTDAHLRPARIADVREGRAYRVRGRVLAPPRTREGGHVVVEIGDGDDRCECIAFAPTGRFRAVVRRLGVGDDVIACGEIGRGTLKLEKFALVGRRLVEPVVPSCPTCGRSMESAGADQGYRCRACRTAYDGKRRETLARTLEPGWYEVPPEARRHLAKPLARAEQALPVHPTDG